MNSKIHPERFTVREAAIGDLEDVVRIDRACFSIPWTRDAFRYELEDNPRALYFVLVRSPGDGEEICGYAGCRYVLDEAEVMNIAVLDSVRRQGGAQRLLNAMLRELKRLKLRRLSLEVREHNLAALSLYEKNGFIPCGRVKGYYPDNGEDALIMALQLS